MANRVLRRGAKVVYFSKNLLGAKGAPVYPVAADALSDIESTFTFAQKREIQDLQRRSGTYSVFDYFQCGYEPSTGSIKVPLKFNAYAGASLAADVHGGLFLEGLYGSAVAAGGPKTWTFAHRGTQTDEIYYTMAVDIDSVKVWLFDVVIGTGNISKNANADTDSVTTLNVNFNNLGFAMAGRSYLTIPAVAGQFVCTVGNPERFTVGAQIVLESEAGFPLQHKITNVDLTTGILTFETAVAAGGVVAGKYVDGYLPTSAAPAGTVIWSGRGYVQRERDTLQAATAGADVHFHADHAQRFEVGDKVQLGEVDSVVYTVTSVDIDGTEVGVTPAIAGIVALGEHIYKLEGNLENNFEINHGLTPEWAAFDTEWPYDILRDEKRTVRITNTRVMTTANSELLLAQSQQTTYQIKMEWGSRTGAVKPWMIITAPKCRITKAVPDFGNPQIHVPTEFECLAPTSETESTCVIYLL